MTWCVAALPLVLAIGCRCGDWVQDQVDDSWVSKSMRCQASLEQDGRSWEVMHAMGWACRNPDGPTEWKAKCVYEALDCGNYRRRSVPTPHPGH